jgi:large subunit ribosomal protein L1
MEKEILKALAELRKNKERKFDQTVDLLINLQKFDARKNQINLFINTPYKIKDKKIGAFLESKSSHIDTITKEEFKKYADKKEAKRLVKKYDFFIAQSTLMPSVATTFGRVLGPSGKMPSPQLGIILNTDEKTIRDVKEKINNSLKIKTKESSIKIAVGKQSMKDNEIAENILAVYNVVLKNLPKEKDNVKNIEIKFTMTKPQKLSIK